MKKKIFSLLLVTGMIISAMPFSAFAGTVAQSPVLVAKATSVEKNNIKITWLHYPEATKYVIYGNEWGKQMKRVKKLKASTLSSQTAYIVKKIGSKKLKAHKVYRFYVYAYNGSKKISRSNCLKVVSTKTLNKTYSNATALNIVHKTVNLEKEGLANAKIIADISSTIYNGKKHLPSKYGPKYRYIVTNPSILTINAEGLMQVQPTAPIGSVATVIVQELNGVYDSFDVQVVNTEEAKTETIVVHDGYYYDGYYYAWYDGVYRPVIRATALNDVTKSTLSKIDAQYDAALSAIPGIDPESTAKRTALRSECIARKSMISDLKDYCTYNPTPRAYDAYVNEITKIYNTPTGVSLNYSDLLKEMLNNM